MAFACFWGIVFTSVFRYCTICCQFILPIDILVVGGYFINIEFVLVVIEFFPEQKSVDIVFINRFRDSVIFVNSFPIILFQAVVVSGD
jgi:hypothetical protein